jgi:phosphatidylglycerol:prolipoprotein diacylglycerol transferase
MEGLFIFLAIGFAAKYGGLKRPGFLSGLFGVLYAAARTLSEFFREPDPKSELLAGGFTMGMVLSAPLAVLGLWLMWQSMRAKNQP